MPFGSGFSHPPVAGSVQREPMTDNYRIIRVDDEGRIQISLLGGGIVIYGLNGAGNPDAFHNYHWAPQPALGQRFAITVASARTAALTLNHNVQFWASVVAWIRIGNNAVNATYAVDFPIQQGAVYTYCPTAAANQYIAVVRDTADGVFYLGQAEA